MSRPYGGLSRDLLVPIRLRPPGYPLLMVPLIKLGVPPVMAATAVATFFSAISVVLLGNLYLTRLPPLLALSTLGASVLMPSFLFLSGMALSDTPYLALALVSLLCVINWTKTTRNQWFWVFTAGAFGGLAWCVRHVAVALLGTSCMFLAAHLLWRPLRVVAARMGCHVKLACLSQLQHVREDQPILDGSFRPIIVGQHQRNLLSYCLRYVRFGPNHRIIGKQVCNDRIIVFSVVGVSFFDSHLYIRESGKLY